MAAVCWKCGKDTGFTPGARPGRRDSCSQCIADLHCCRNCEWYDPLASNQCREPQADRVVEKERANFCDYFRFARDRGPGANVTAQTIKALDDLFKK